MPNAPDNSNQEDPPPTQDPPSPPPPAGEDWKARFEALERKNKASERAKMDETERLKAEKADADAAREAAENRLQETSMRTAFLAAATKAGALDPADVYALADKSQLTLTAAGELAGADKVLQSLRKSKGYLFRAGGGLGSGGGNPGTSPELSVNQRANQWIRGQAGRL